MLSLYFGHQLIQLYGVLVQGLVDRVHLRRRDLWGCRNFICLHWVLLLGHGGVGSAVSASELSLGPLGAQWGCCGLSGGAIGELGGCRSCKSCKSCKS